MTDYDKNDKFFRSIGGSVIHCFPEDESLINELFGPGIDIPEEEDNCDFRNGENGLEHFKIYSTEDTKTGAELEHEIRRIYKNYQEYPYNDDGVKIINHVSTNSIANLLASFEKNFNNHYSKVSRYKTKHERVYFIVEVISACYTVENGPFRIYRDKRVLEFLKEKTEINGVFFVELAEKNDLYFISIPEIEKYFTKENFILKGYTEMKPVVKEIIMELE